MKPMYCPTCFANTLKVQSKGVIKIEMNRKHRDANLMLYNLSHEGQDDMRKELKVKITEFLSWYSSFQNPEPIAEVNFYSNSFECSAGCSVGVDARLSIADILISRDEIKQILTECCKRYDVEVEQNVEIL